MKMGVITAVATWFAMAAQPTLAEEWLVPGHTPAAVVSGRAATSFAPSYIFAKTAEAPTELAQMGLLQPPLDRTEAVRMELHSYGTYQNDWDGEGATAPRKADAENAISLLGKIPSGLPIPKPMLSSSGVIGMYWDHPALFADIALEENGTFSLFTREKESKAETYVENVSIADLDLAWLAGSLEKLRGV